MTSLSLLGQRSIEEPLEGPGTFRTAVVDGRAGVTHPQKDKLCRTVEERAGLLEEMGIGDR